MTKQLIALLTLAVLSAAPARAAGPVHLQLTAERKTETADAQGKTHVVWTALGAGQGAVHPGDVLRYRVQAENSGAAAVSGLAVTQPVPAGTVYVARSAEGDAAGAATVTYSLDGKQFSARPMQTVVGADGVARLRPAPPESYAALRWRFPALPPHASASVFYLVKVR